MYIYIYIYMYIYIYIYVYIYIYIYVYIYIYIIIHTAGFKKPGDLQFLWNCNALWQSFHNCESYT